MACNIDRIAEIQLQNETRDARAAAAAAKFTQFSFIQKGAPSLNFVINNEAINTDNLEAGTHGGICYTMLMCKDSDIRSTGVDLVLPGFDNVAKCWADFNNWDAGWVKRDPATSQMRDPAMMSYSDFLAVDEEDELRLTAEIEEALRTGSLSPRLHLVNNCMLSFLGYLCQCNEHLHDMADDADTIDEAYELWDDQYMSQIAGCRMLIAHAAQPDMLSRRAFALAFAENLAMAPRFMGQILPDFLRPQAKQILVGMAEQNVLAAYLLHCVVSYAAQQRAGR